ncbi:hypothetical protein FRX31_021205 [Thalictrum thalictroides]|uniref:Uncharacterized protein n=1 Tax=Thalictrum thalictroides TaxID=46969 RepID=A0A7J6VX73_THATH|nr:hypothetical protein FRX31_021205 [Thalictrum thalictroides]
MEGGRQKFNFGDGMVMGGGDRKIFWVGDGDILEMVEDSEEEELEKQKIKERVAELLKNPPKRPDDKTILDVMYENLSEKWKNRARHALGMEEKYPNPLELPKSSLPLTPKELCRLDNVYDEYRSTFSEESEE